MRGTFTAIRAAAISMALAAAISAGHAQTFPFADSFSNYTPGATGGPAWSALSGAFTPRDGALRGPVVLRFNRRPPRQYTAETVLRPMSGAPSAAGGVKFDIQGEEKAFPADGITVLISGKQATVQMDAFPDRKADVAVPEGEPVRLRVTVDEETGRAAAFINDQAALTSVPCEYPGGLVALGLGEGAEAVSFALRAPSEEERKAVRVTTLFNDPRDLADADDGNLMVLHRGSPAVLVVTPDGEVIRSFGRRMPAGVPDPVALVRGPQREVLVLNRNPGEVVVYERNGGIRYRFGAGRLVQPADMAVLPDGTVYVADAGAGRVVAYSLRGQYLGSSATLGSGGPLPRRIALDAQGNLLVVCDEPARVVRLRPEADRARLTLVGESSGALDDALAVDAKTLALHDGAVSAWPPEPDAPSYRAQSLGGLGAGRLALVHGAVWALDRTHSRLVAVPDSLKDAVPEVTFQNISQTSALVRWTSSAPSETATVRLLRGSTWDTITQRENKPVREHQVVLERLLPGRTYKYTITPTVTTIPAGGETATFSFDTAPAPAAAPATRPAGTGEGAPQ